MTRSQRLLLCTDLDRTVIPNGPAPEHPDARRRFREFCALPEVTLAYVSGRHLQLVEDAIVTWQLPKPDFAITDVGTRIWRMREAPAELMEWGQLIARDWRGQTHGSLCALLAPIHGLQLQEADKQSRHKLSFYLPQLTAKDSVLSEIHARLREDDVQAAVVWSVDELTGTGLIDVLPLHATKLHAILYVQQMLGYREDEIIFAGDSGNDLDVLASHVPSVLVGNASDEVRQAALTAVRATGRESSLYVADANASPEANYTAGVLQGVWHFLPEFHAQFAGDCRD